MMGTDGGGSGSVDCLGSSSKSRVVNVSAMVVVLQWWPEGCWGRVTGC